MKTLGEKIRYYRNLKNWSQDAMADKLNLSLPAYSKIERNITDVGCKRLLQLSKVFGIHISELVSLSNKPFEQNNLLKELTEKEKEINQLQKKVIELMEKDKMKRK